MHTSGTRIKRIENPRKTRRTRYIRTRIIRRPAVIYARDAAPSTRIIIATVLWYFAYLTRRRRTRAIVTIHAYTVVLLRLLRHGTNRFTVGIGTQIGVRSAVNLLR